MPLADARGPVAADFDPRLPAGAQAYTGLGGVCRFSRIVAEDRGASMDPDKKISPLNAPPVRPENATLRVRSEVVAKLRELLRKPPEK